MQPIYKMIAKCIVATAVACQLSACTTANPSNPEDPLEPYNRVAFRFNDTLDTYLLKPTAHFYNKVMPTPVNNAINHFFKNLDEIPAVANDVLQGELKHANNDFWRFVINSTIGLLGFFDVAESVGLKAHYNDFGQTLARWGYTRSPYLVIPFLGPSTIRDAVGLPVDYTYLSIYHQIDDVQTRNLLWLGSALNSRAQLERYHKVFKQAALDKYTFVRNAYLQKRHSLIGDTNEKSTGKHKQPDYLDEWADEESHPES